MKEKASKELNWRDYWAIAMRRRWSLLGPLFGLGLLGFAVAHLWPVRYRSEALILVEQQKVPEQYVTPNVVAGLEDRLEGLRQQVLSRTRLERLIEQFALYPQDRSRMTTDELVDQMREDIGIEPVKAAGRPGDLTAFRISYVAPAPATAQRVVNELTSRFIEEDLRARSQQSASTTDFLEKQLDAARQSLAQREQVLRDYKMRYLGELPEQQQANLQILSSLQGQLGSASAARDRAEQEKTYLESMQAQYRSLQSSLGTVDGAGHFISPDLALKDLRVKLEEMQAKYTDHYPDVSRLKKQIIRWEALKEQIEAEQAATAKQNTDKTKAVPGQPNLIEFDSRLKAIRLEIDHHKREIDNVTRRIQEVQAHLSLTPVREQQMAEVTRDYENARQAYQSLLQKSSQSELATSLEKRQQGERFSIIDPASFPERPVEPDRAEIILAGWLLGLMASVGLTAFQESMDTRLHSEEEIASCTKIPVLVSIPVLRSPSGEARQRRQRGLEAAALAVLLVVSVASAVYTYLAG